MKQGSAGWDGSPVYHFYREESVFIIFGRGGDLLIFGLSEPLQRGVS